MRAILSLALLLAAIAASPFSTASNNACAPGVHVCAGEGSYAAGSCDAGYVYNGAYVALPVAYVGVVTACGGGEGYHYSGVQAFASTPAGLAFVDWSAYDVFGQSACDSTAHADPAGSTHAGCPAGAPPDVPIALP